MLSSTRLLNINNMMVLLHNDVPSLDTNGMNANDNNHKMLNLVWFETNIDALTNVNQFC